MPADEYNKVLLELSSAIRDIQEEILAPGGRPAQQDQEALASSLLGARYTKSTLKAKCQQKQKPKYIPSTPLTPPTVGSDTPYKKPFWRTDKPKPTKAAQGQPSGNQPSNAIGTQADL